MSQELNVPNLDKLIAHLEAQPPEAVNMAYVLVVPRGNCGTCGCLIGHAALIFSIDGTMSDGRFERRFGLSEDHRRELTQPEGWEDERPGRFRYPAHRVIATLKRLRHRFLATGEVVVDWGPEPGSEPAQAWATPQAIEMTPPELPAEITRLLGADRAEATHV